MNDNGRDYVSLLDAISKIDTQSDEFCTNRKYMKF